MDVNSRSACRDRSVFWAKLADAELQSIQERYLTTGASNKPTAHVTAIATVGGVWATLALSAPEP